LKHKGAVGVEHHLLVVQANVAGVLQLQAHQSTHGQQTQVT
jgi:hypothetical protein